MIISTVRKISTEKKDSWLNDVEFGLVKKFLDFLGILNERNMCDHPLFTWKQTTNVVLLTSLPNMCLERSSSCHIYFEIFKKNVQQILGYFHNIWMFFSSQKTASNHPIQFHVLHFELMLVLSLCSVPQAHHQYVFFSCCGILVRFLILEPKVSCSCQRCQKGYLKQYI